MVADGEVDDVCEVFDETGAEGAFACAGDAEDVDDGCSLWFPGLSGRIGDWDGHDWCCGLAELLCGGRWSSWKDGGRNLWTSSWLLISYKSMLSS